MNAFDHAHVVEFNVVFIFSEDIIEVILSQVFVGQRESGALFIQQGLQSAQNVFIPSGSQFFRLVFGCIGLLVRHYQACIAG